MYLPFCTADRVQKARSPAADDLFRASLTKCRRDHFKILLASSGKYLVPAYRNGMPAGSQRHLYSLLDHFPEFILCQHRDSQLSGFTLLGTCILACNHKSCFLGYGTRCFTAQQFDFLGCLFPCKAA